MRSVTRAFTARTHKVREVEESSDQNLDLLDLQDISAKTVLVGQDNLRAVD